MNIRILKYKILLLFLLCLIVVIPLVWGVIAYVNYSVRQDCMAECEKITNTLVNSSEPDFTTSIEILMTSYHFSIIMCDHEQQRCLFVSPDYKKKFLFFSSEKYLIVLLYECNNKTNNLNFIIIKKLNKRLNVPKYRFYKETFSQHFFKKNSLPKVVDSKGVF